MYDDTKELKEIASINDFLEVDRSGKGYICPKCGSGSGKNGTGLKAVPDKPGYYHCFRAGCDLYADIIELVAIKYTNNDFKAAKDFIRNRYGIKPGKPYPKPSTTTNTPAARTEEKDPVKEKALLDEIRNTMKEAEKHLSESNYLTGRGISEKTAKRFHIGFCANWRYPGKPNATPEPRIIIPLNDHAYQSRTLKKESTAKYLKVGGNELFNPDALFDYTQPCFITEGEINALSIIEAGYNACALGSGNNDKKLAQLLQERTPTHLILYMDYDQNEAGKKYDTKLQEQLSEIGIAYTTITGKNTQDNDANDFLMRSKSDFQKFLAEAHDEAKNAMSAEINEYMKQNCVSSYIDEFMNINESRAATPCTPTGFRALDKVLDGGLYEGLYILGAPSSLGKTTLAWQIANQISEKGQHVIFFSLEQSKYELVAKGLSCETANICADRGDDLSTHPRNARTIREITNSQRYATLDPGQLETLATAMNNYKEKSKHLHVIEGLGDIGVKDIRAVVDRYTRGNIKPVVFIDYLQIMAVPDKKNYTDKQVVDLNMSYLKKLSRDLKLTIVGISSFNRDSYTTGANMAAFKESGAIEYSSDVLMGLQLADIDYTKQSPNEKQKTRQNIDDGKKKDPRDIKLVILKNRNGALGDVNFEYYPAYNKYKEKLQW